MRLQAKLILAVVPLIVAPLVTLGLLGYQQWRERSTELILGEMRNHLQNVTQNFDATLRNAQANLELFSNSTLLQKYVLTADDRERYRLMLAPLLRLFAGYQKAYPDYYEIRVLLPDGYEDARATTEPLPNSKDEEGDSRWFLKLEDTEIEPFTYFRFLATSSDSLWLSGSKRKWVNGSVSVSSSLRNHRESPSSSLLLGSRSVVARASS